MKKAFAVCAPFIIFLIFVAVKSSKDDAECLSKGGTMIKTSHGYECLKVEKL